MPARLTPEELLSREAEDLLRDVFEKKSALAMLLDEEKNRTTPSEELSRAIAAKKIELEDAEHRATRAREKRALAVRMFKLEEAQQAIAKLKEYTNDKTAEIALLKLEMRARMIEMGAVADERELTAEQRIDEIKKYAERLEKDGVILREKSEDWRKKADAAERAERPDLQAEALGKAEEHASAAKDLEGELEELEKILEKLSALTRP